MYGKVFISNPENLPFIQWVIKTRKDDSEEGVY
jgi:hypothetical protein